MNMKLAAKIMGKVGLVGFIGFVATFTIYMFNLENKRGSLDRALNRSLKHGF